MDRGLAAGDGRRGRALEDAARDLHGPVPVAGEEHGRQHAGEADLCEIVDTAVAAVVARLAVGGHRAGVIAGILQRRAEPVVSLGGSAGVVLIKG